MEYFNEVWRTDFYKLQKQAPKAIPVPNRTNIESKPFYGIEYHGSISQKEVEKIMETQTSGAYIIRNGLTAPGTYTLVIKFDDSLKNYKLYFDFKAGLHYVGNKFFKNISDLVQDGLINLYIESRGAAYIKKIAECNIYEESPFYKARCTTLQKKWHIQFQGNTDEGQLANRNNAYNRQQKNIIEFNANETMHYKRKSALSNNPIMNLGVDVEQIGKSFGHPSINSSQIAPQEQLLPGFSSKTFSNNQVNPEVSEDSISEVSLLDTDLQIETSSENMNSLNDSSCSLSSADTIFYSIETLTDSQIPIDLKSVSSKNIMSQYSLCFADQEKSHNFKIHSFKGPNWCDFCTHFMWGLVSQGMKCKDCGFQAHRKCSVRVPCDCLPVMKCLKRVFGVELTSLGKIESRGVPLILLRLIALIESRGLEVEGIYRLSGNAELVDDVKADLDKDIGSVDFETDIRLADMHNVASLIKLFFRQLPIPLITIEVSSLITDLFKSEEKENVRLEHVKDSLLSLPSMHYCTLTYFMAHLHRLSNLSDINKMTVENLAIVFAPSLIDHQIISVSGMTVLSAVEMQEIIHRTIQSSVDIIEYFIKYSDILFDRDQSILLDGF